MRGIRRSSALVEASALASEEELRRCGMLESLKRDIPVLVVNESSLRTILPGAVAAAIVPGEIPLSLGRASSRLRSILERQELPYILLRDREESEAYRLNCLVHEVTHVLRPPRSWGWMNRIIPNQAWFCSGVDRHWPFHAMYLMCPWEIDAHVAGLRAELILDREAGYSWNTEDPPWCHLAAKMIWEMAWSRETAPSVRAKQYATLISVIQSGEWPHGTAPTWCKKIRAAFERGEWPLGRIPFG
jgi:hypothetical protein